MEVDTGAPCLFFVGGIGGMMTPDVEDHSFEEAEAIGNTLAQAALGALSTIEPMAAYRLEHACQEYRIPLDNPVLGMAMQAGLLSDLTDKDGNVISEVNLLKIGPAWFAGVPGELLPKLGVALKADLGQAGARVAGIIGLANDELGYILPQEEYIFPKDPFEPGDHYEETMSIGPEAGPRLVSALRAMLG